MCRVGTLFVELHDVREVVTSVGNDHLGAWLPHVDMMITSLPKRRLRASGTCSPASCT